MSKELNRLKIKVGPGSSYYDNVTNTIYIGSEQIEEAKSLNDIIDVINHEMQHAVQRNFGAREDTSNKKLKDKALDIAYKYHSAHSAGKVPIVERDAVFLQKDPTKGSWYSKMTPKEKKVYYDYMQNEDEKSLNKNWNNFKKSNNDKIKSPPDIKISSIGNFYTPNKNLIGLNYKNKKNKNKSKKESDEINFRNILDRLNHELQHYAQFSTLSQEEIDNVLKEYNKKNLLSDLHPIFGELYSGSPLIELDAIQTESEPTLSTWYESATPEQKKKIRDYLEESVNKTLPAPEITIGEETKYEPYSNKIYIGGNKEISFEELLDKLNHELQHYAQTMEISQNELYELMNAYKDRFYNKDIPLIEYDAIQSESDPFFSEWGQRMSDEQANRLAQRSGIPDPLETLRMTKAFILFKMKDPSDINVDIFTKE